MLVAAAKRSPAAKRTKEPATRAVATTVRRIGRAHSGQGWDMETEPTLGSCYPSHYYGKVWEEVTGLQPGAQVTLHLSRGALKHGKSGALDTHWFWDVTDIRTPRPCVKMGRAAFLGCALPRGLSAGTRA